MREKRNFLIAALDCETRPPAPGVSALYGPECFVTCAYNTDIPALEFFSFKGFLMWLFGDEETPGFLDREVPEGQLSEAKRIWYSHNGEFDWVRMIKAFEPYKEFFDIFAKERAHGTIYELCIKEKGKNKIVTRFRDSMAIFNGSLRSFLEIFSPETPKGEIDFEKENFDRKNPAHRSYACNDSTGLQKAMIEYDKFIYKHFGVHLSATASGIAYQAWRRTLPSGTAIWRAGKRAEAFFRLCYVGGMVQMNCYRCQSYLRVDSYDVNSSYPASMRLGVPKGKAFRTHKYHDSAPGFYRVTFTCPEDFVLPVLAHKDPKGLSFPVGSNIETYTSSIEIDYARSLGYQVTVHDGYWFPEGLIYPFDAYVSKCETLRRHPDIKGKSLEKVVKQMQNSLYGRFGMSPEGREIMIDFDGGYEGWGCVINSETGENLSNVFYKDTERNTEYMLPHWAAWITANSRILLDKGCRAVGAHRVLYRDTDSLYIQGPVQNLDIDPNRYGAWKHEKTFNDFRVHGPKIYSWFHEGEYGAKAKGMPQKLLKEQALAKQIHSGEMALVSFESPNKFLTAQKTGLMGQDRTRTQTDPKNIYSHVLDKNDFFRPRKVA